MMEYEYHVTASDQPVAAVFHSIADAIKFVKLQLAKGRTMTITRVEEEQARILRTSRNFPDFS